MKALQLIPAAALLLAGSVLAAAPQFGEADANGDGNISLAEFENAQLERARERFAKLDQDANGVLTGEEIREHAHERRSHRRHGRPDPERVLEKLDADGSGGVSLAEFDDARFKPDAEGFAAADADGNGELDASELGALARERFRGRHRSRDGDDQG